MKWFRLFLICTLLSTALFQTSTFASDEDTMFTYGKVTGVTATDVTLEEYDEDTDSFKDVVYQVSNLVDISSIKVGQSIDVNFTGKGDKKTLTSFEVFEEN